jgi:hypothetical protein
MRLQVMDGEQSLMKTIGINDSVQLTFKSPKPASTFSLGQPMSRKNSLPSISNKEKRTFFLTVKEVCILFQLYVVFHIFKFHFSVTFDFLKRLSIPWRFQLDPNLTKTVN